MVRPRARAVLRLMTRSNGVGCSGDRGRRAHAFWRDCGLGLGAGHGSGSGRPRKGYGRRLGLGHHRRSLRNALVMFAIHRFTSSPE
jgi:hypothetical protein